MCVCVCARVDVIMRAFGAHNMCVTCLSGSFLWLRRHRDASNSLRAILTLPTDESTDEKSRRILKRCSRAIASMTNLFVCFRMQPI